MVCATSDFDKRFRKGSYLPAFMLYKQR